MMKWVCLAAGGTAGTLARYLLASAVYARTGADFPYGTLVVNGLGCFLMGLLAGLDERRALLSPEVRALLVIGFLGAFTTFSALTYESWRLLREGQALLAGANVLGTAAAGFAALWLGIRLGNLIQ